MKKLLSFHLLLLLFLFIFGCDNSTNINGRKPRKVILLPTAPVKSEKECGIDAVPESDAIRVEWQPADDEMIAGYLLYRSLDGMKFKKIASVSNVDSAYQDNDIKIYKRYYYFIKANSKDNIHSDPSDTLNYMLVKKAVALHVNVDNSKSKPVFCWRDANTPAESQYVLKLIEANTGKYIWITTIESSYSDGNETIQYNWDQQAAIDSLKPNVEYNWRIDIPGSNISSGSESQWDVYNYQ